MARPYPQEFRDDVVRVARNRADGVTIEQIAADFGVHPITLSKWMRQAAVDDGSRCGTSMSESAQLRELRRRNRLLEQENEGCAGPRRICRSRACRKRLYPLVKELAADGVPVAVTCRVLQLARQPYYRWLADPITDAELYRFLVDEARDAGHPMAERTAWRIALTTVGEVCSASPSAAKTAMGDSQIESGPMTTGDEICHVAGRDPQSTNDDSHDRHSALIATHRCRGCREV